MFQGQSHTWLRLFQCKRMDLAPDARLHPMFAELLLVYDHWKMAAWFARPSQPLGAGARFAELRS